jgi:YihY family inner membrane protein
MTTAAPVPDTRELEGEDAVETVRRVRMWKLLGRALTRFRLADGFSHSRALAFQLVLTLLPGLIAVVGLARVLDQRTFTDVFTETVRDITPGPASEVLTRAFRQGSESAASSGEAALFLGLAAALISAATALGQFERGANRIYGIERDRALPHKYLVAAILALSAGLAFACAFVLVVFGASLGNAVESVIGWRRGLALAWSIARWPLGAALTAVAVTMLFRVSPRRPQPAFSWLALGSTLTVALWFAFTGALALFIDLSQGFGETYGPLAGFIGLLIWALLTALALFAGLAVAAQLEAERGGASEPDAESPAGIQSSG